MPRTIRFHLDENCDSRIAAGLRLHGIDLTTTTEAGLLRASDEDQLRFATSEDRVLVTRDADFLRMSAEGAAHAGIAYFRPEKRSLGELIRLLVLIWEVLEAGEMRGHVEYL
jgi:predicted nuclease of predicted toxin-antitoxin system